MAAQGVVAVGAGIAGAPLHLCGRGKGYASKAILPLFGGMAARATGTLFSDDRA